MTAYPNWLVQLACKICSSQLAGASAAPDGPTTPPAPPVWTMSEFALANLMHFENDPLRTGELQLDKSRYDALGQVSGEIGYGLTPNGVVDAKRYKVVPSSYQIPSQQTREQAYRTLVDVTVPTYAKMVDKVVTVPLNQDQKDALIMFAFNVGEGNLKTMVAQKGRLNDGNYEKTPYYMSLYNKASGKTATGLVRRRAFESALFAGDHVSASNKTGVFGFDKHKPY